MKKTFFIILLLALPLLFGYPETIKLKSGKIVESTIVERTDSYIKVDIAGIPITYYLDDIENIDGVSISKERKETSLSQTTGIESSSTDIDTDQIHKILKHLGYPESTWPAIEQELTVFLAKIDFPRLKKEAAQVKSNPEQLKNFISGVGRFIEREGCRDTQFPHPLIKLLVISLGTEDILQVIDNSLISPQEKERFRKELLSCSAVSQLGSIILKLLDIKIKVAFTPEHVFNCIPLDVRQMLFIDFFNQVFAIVDINSYYNIEGKYMILKEEYRLPSDRINEIVRQWVSKSAAPNSPKELLPCFYSNIYITDDYAATPSIYTNSAKIYTEANGNYDRAIADCNKAIEINPNDAVAYYNRGSVYPDKGNYNQAIADFNKAIEINPDYAKAYANQGIAYARNGNYDKAIANFIKAIEINPNDASGYYNRGVAYFGKDDFDKAWEDVHKAESLGYEVIPEFLEELKKASGREK